MPHAVDRNSPRFAPTYDVISMGDWRTSAQHYSFNIRFPVVRGVIKDLNVSQTVTVQNDLAVTQRTSGVDSRFNVTSNLEEIVSVDPCAGMTCIDTEEGITLPRAYATQEPVPRRI